MAIGGNITLITAPIPRNKPSIKMPCNHSGACAAWNQEVKYPSAHPKTQQSYQMVR